MLLGSSGSAKGLKPPCWASSTLPSAVVTAAFQIAAIMLASADSRRSAPTPRASSAAVAICVVSDLTSPSNDLSCWIVRRARRWLTTMYSSRTLAGSERRSALISSSSLNDGNGQAVEENETVPGLQEQELPFLMILDVGLGRIASTRITAASALTSRRRVGRYFMAFNINLKIHDPSAPRALATISSVDTSTSVAWDKSASCATRSWSMVA